MQVGQQAEYRVCELLVEALLIAHGRFEGKILDMLEEGVDGWKEQKGTKP